MKAVQVRTDTPKQIHITEIPDPVAGAGEVRVRMEWGGICGSDLSYWKNGASGTAIMREPLILGHEVAGVVDQVGEGVAGVEVGQRVAIYPPTLVGEHDIPESTRGKDNLWPEVRYFGSAAFFPHEQGGFSTYRVVRPDQLRVLPENVSTKEGAVAEPLAVAMHAVTLAGDLSGKRVLVNGVGPIGALAVAAVKFAGAREVIASDVSAESLRVASAMGATRTVNRSAGEGLPADVDVTIEASGAAVAIGDCLMATVRGGTMVQVGNLPAGEVSVVLGQLVTREITYRGSYRFNPESMDAAIDAMARGLDVSPVLTHEFKIDDAAAAFATADDRSTGSSKVMLQLS